MRNEDFCELICDKFKNLNRLTWMWKNLGNIYDFDVKFRNFYACVTRTIPKSHVDIACNRASPSFGVFHPCLIEYKSLSGKWQCKYTNQRTEIESKFFLPLRRAPGMFFLIKTEYVGFFARRGAVLTPDLSMREILDADASMQTFFKHFVAFPRFNWQIKIDMRQNNL